MFLTKELQKIAGTLLVISAVAVVWIFGEFTMAALLVLGLLFGAYAVAVWRRAPFGTNEVICSGLFLLCLVGLIVPAAFGAIFSSSKALDLMGQVDGSLNVLAGIGCFLVLAAAAWFIFGRPARWSDGRFLLITASIIVLARVLFLVGVWMIPKNDFDVMWTLSGMMVEDGFFARSGTYYERAIPYLYPLRALFGESWWSFKIGNTVLSLGSSLLTFQLTRFWFGSRSARVAFLLSFLALETWLASGIPSHDVPGTFLLLACMSLFVAMFSVFKAHPGRALLLSLLLGVALAVLDLQRTNAIFLIVVMPIAGLGQLLLVPKSITEAVGNRRTRSIAAAAIVLLALPIVTHGVVKSGLREAGVVRPAGQHVERRISKIAAYTDSWGTGSWAHWSANWQGRDAGERGWGKFVGRKLLTDVYYNPVERVSHYIREGERLYRLGSHMNWYVEGARLASGRRANGDDGRMVRSATAWFATVFLLLLVTGVWRWWQFQGKPTLELMPLLYLAVMSSVFIFLFETQGRYMYPIWYLGSIYIGFLFRDVPSNDIGRRFVDSRPEGRPA